MSRHGQQLIQAFQVQTHIFELLLDRTAHLIVFPLPLFDDAQKRLSGILHVHLRLLKLTPERLEHLGDEALQHFSGLVEQYQIGWIADILWRTGGIQNQGPVIIAAFLGRILIIVIVFANAAKNVIDSGHSGGFDPFAKVNEGGSTDRRCRLEF